MKRNDIVGLSRIGCDALENEIPISVAIELLTNCNWRCKHCYIPSHECDGLKYEVIIKLIDELRSIGTFHVLLTGGELLLRNDIIDIVKYIRDSHMRVSILSNGSLITDELAKKMSELYISDFSLSIFSLNEEIHDDITGVRGSLNKALKGAETLALYNIPVEFKTPLLSQNALEYKKIQDFCKIKGYNFSVSPCISPKNNGDLAPINFSPNIEQLKEIIEDIDNISSYHKQDSMPELMCQTLKHSLFISSKGEVYPCNGLFLSYGNITKESVQKIWNKSEYKKLRNLQNSLTVECNQCEYLSYCERCLGIVYTMTNNLYGCASICKNIAVARKEVYNKEVKINV